MTILLASNNAIHMGGYPTTSVAAGTLDSAKVDYSIEVFDESAVALAFPHIEAVGDTTWYQWDVYVPGSPNASDDGAMFSIRDIDGNVIYEINLGDGAMASEVYGPHTLGVVGGFAPLPGSTISSLKVKLTVNATETTGVLYLNGTTISTATADNTRALGKPRFVDFSLYDALSTTAALAVSEIVVSDSDLGNFGFTKLVPASAGTDTDWTGDGFASLSDDDQGSGITAIALNEKNSYNMDAYAGGANINAYVATAVIGGGSVAGSYRFYLLIGGTHYYGDTVALADGVAVLASYVWDTDPSDSAVWTAAKINAAQLGVEVL
jgi:hypothetical protein